MFISIEKKKKSGHEANVLIKEFDNEQEINTVIRVEDEELENIFNL